MFRIKFSREITLKLLYQAEITGLDGKEAEDILAENLTLFRGLKEKEEEFILKILKKILAERDSIDELIAKNLIGWKLERLLPIDRNLLRMGIAESHFNDQKAVIIDDIVRIAKKYGSEESYKIINAVLDKVIA